jgi:general secretion pathway protein H
LVDGLKRVNGGSRIADSEEPIADRMLPAAGCLPPFRSSPSAVRDPPFTSFGFTLLEILVVVVIMGIIVSMAMLSVNMLGRDSEVEDQAKRFWAVLQQTKEESELQSVNVGVFISAEAYEFLRFDQRQNLWIPIGDDKLYATRRLPEGLRFRLWLDSREAVLKPDLPQRTDEDEDEEDKEQTGEEKKEAELPEALRTIDRDKPPKTQSDPPQVVILSNGDIMPFELLIERDRAPATWRLQALPDNDLRVERRDEKNSQEWVIVSQTRPPEDDSREVPANARK